MAIISKGPRQRKSKRSGMDHINGLWNPKDGAVPKSDKYFNDKLADEHLALLEARKKEATYSNIRDLYKLQAYLTEELSPFCQSVLREGSPQHSKHIVRCTKISILADKHPVYKKFVDDFRAGKGTPFEVKVDIRDYIKLIKDTL